MGAKGRGQARLQLRATQLLKTRTEFLGRHLLRRGVRLRHGRERVHERRLAADAPFSRLGDRVRGEVERVHEGRATQPRFFPFGNFDVLLRELAEEIPFAARPA